MLKVIISGCRTDHLTRADFFQHLLHSHAPLVRSSTALAPYLLRYVQNHVQNESDGCHLPYALRKRESRDSVIELWWENFTSLKSALAHPDYLATVRVDEEYFTNQSNLLVLLAQEHEVFFNPTLPSTLKSFDFLKVREGVSAVALFEAAQTNAGVMHRQPGIARRRIINKVVNPASATFAHAAAYDLVCETWISDLTGFAPVHAEELGLLSDYLDTEESFTVYATEFPILDRTQ